MDRRQSSGARLAQCVTPIPDGACGGNARGPFERLATMGALAALTFAVGITAVLTSAAAAQHEAHASVTVSDEIYGWGGSGQSATLEQTCADATRTEWAMRVSGGDALTCTLDPSISPGLAPLRIRHARGEVLVLARTRGTALEPIAGLLEVEWPAGESGETAIVSVTRRAVRGWPVLLVETRSSGREMSLATERRDLVVCVHPPGDLSSLACVVRAPLAWVTSAATATATATIERDGTLALERTSGGWAQILGPPDRTGPLDPSGLIAMPMRPSDIDARTTSARVPILYIDQWHESAASQPQLAQAGSDVGAPGTRGDPTDHEPARGLADLCAHAERWLEDPGDHVLCNLFATEVPSMFLVSVSSRWGIDLFVAVGAPGALRAVARIGRVALGPTQHGWTRVLAVHRRRVADEDVLAVETESSFVDYDLGLLEARGFESRYLTICAHAGEVATLRCGARIPLSYRPFVYEMREVAPRAFPYVWRRIPGEAHEAIAVLRDDGTVRVTLREGSWSVLSELEHHNPLPVVTPTDAAAHVVVSMFPSAGELQRSGQ